MKILQQFLASLVLVLVIGSCSSNYGKEFKLDENHSVYYQGEGISETHAKNLAHYLKDIEYFQDSISATVQIEKVKDTINLNFVVDETKLTNGYENGFLLLGGFIPDSVFNKAPVVVQLTNNRLEPFKTLGYATPVNEETIK